MTYATEAAFALLIGARETLALTDEDNDGVADAGRLAAALDAASADIDALLGLRAATVAEANPKLLENACIHFARWQLSGASASETDPIKTRHDYYSKLLLDLTDGTPGNETGTGSGTVDAHGGEATVFTAGRVFDRGNRRY
jgi:phage gp36-like protein